MLKDKLKNLNQRPDCIYGSFYQTLDKETQQILNEAMLSNAPTVDIFKALKSEGCEASETTLRRIRTLCYKSGVPCKCISE